jgi:DNA-damage-inducible protein J
MSVKDAMIRARMKVSLKNEAEAVFGRLGLNATDAITLFYSQVVLKKGIPFALDLEENDTPDQYISVNSDEELRSLIDLD